MKKWTMIAPAAAVLALGACSETEETPAATMPENAAVQESGPIPEDEIEQDAPVVGRGAPATDVTADAPAREAPRRAQADALPGKAAPPPSSGEEAVADPHAGHDMSDPHADHDMGNRIGE